VKGLLADIHLKGHVEDLVREMRSPEWVDFWNQLGLSLFHFEDIGLTPTSTDREIWQQCQAKGLILITNNRNNTSPDSLENTIRNLNKANALPVFTIGNLEAFRKSRGLRCSGAGIPLHISSGNRQSPRHWPFVFALISIEDASNTRSCE
jgi:hypothetical protein